MKKAWKEPKTIRIETAAEISAYAGTARIETAPAVSAHAGTVRTGTAAAVSAHAQTAGPWPRRDPR